MTRDEILTQIKITIVDVVENCNDAYVSGGAAHDEAIEAYEQVAEYIDELFDDFESRTCINCKRLVENYKGFKFGCNRLDFIVSEDWFCADWCAKDDI